MRFWNLVHYCMYESQLNFHKLFRFINPVYYLYKVPFIKRYFEKKYNTDNMPKYVDDAVFDDPSTGQPIVWAGMHIGVILISFQIIIFNAVQHLINKNLNNYIFENEKYKFIAVVTLLTIAGVINYTVVFKDKKYLIYFEDFNKISRNTIIWYCVSLAFAYILLIVMTIYSFSWLKNI
jgi:hypothetical protein